MKLAKDGRGAAILGYGLEDADEMFGDDIAPEATSKGSPDISRLRDGIVRLRIALADARLYPLA